MNIISFPENTRLLLALSGGIDSMVMLDMLYNDAKKNSYILEAVTVNHNIRKEGKTDAEFTADVCKKYGIKCIIKNIDVLSYANEQGISTETAARILRHQAINEEADGFDYICFAHHANDQAESVLMHIMRGSGNGGICGMKAIEGKKARPLINITRNEIEVYAKANNIKFVTDITNFDTSYKRNFVRHKLLPVMEQYNSNIIPSLCSMAKKAQTDEDFLINEAQKVLSKATITENKAIINAELIRGIHRAIAVRVVLMLLEKLELRVDAFSYHIDSIIALCGSQSGKKINLHHNACAYNEFGKLVISKEQNKNIISKEIPLSILLTEGKIVYNGTIVVASAVRPSHNYLYIDSDKLPIDCVIRNRHNGDIIEKFGGVKKKLKDFLIEKKVPLSIRDKLPLIAKDNEIYVVCGTDISNKIKTDTNTENILYISIENTDISEEL